MPSEDKPFYRPGVFSGALVGLLLTAAFIAVLYAGWKIAGLPFIPFDIFDWLARVLPGALIEFVIGTTVTIIHTLHLGPTSVVAKQIEQGIGIFNLLITGIVGGAVLFAILRETSERYAYLFGIIFAIIIGVPALIISLTMGKTATAAPGVNAVWIIVTYFIWGILFGWAYRRLSVPHAVPAPSVGTTAPAKAWVEPIDRRRFLVKLAGSAAVITVAGAVVGTRFSEEEKITSPSERWSGDNPLPNADAAVMPAPGTRPEFTSLEDHYRIDINTFPPMIDEKSWSLKISGLVDKALSITLDEIRQHESMDQFITLACISNTVGGDLIGTTRWTGVSLQKLLEEWGIKPQATHLMIHSADDYYEVISLEAIRSDPRIMLTYEWDGVPLPGKHGFPLRIYIPDRYGMKQPKWIESIEAIDHNATGYWVDRGWNETARMKATSVIDTVAVKSIIESDGQKLVPIGGIAHAGARGISKVEIKVDDNPWVAADLRSPLSGLTWVIWRYNWPFQSGNHNFTVRCYDGQGVPQSAQPAPPYPDGASGLYGETKKI